MPQEFIKTTLSEQIADYLRRCLFADRWGGTLPTEAELCRELKVSRGSLREALKTMIHEGIIESHGRGKRYSLSQGAPREAQPPKSPVAGKIARILSPQPFLIQVDLALSVYQVAAERLGRSRVRLEYEYHRGIGTTTRPGALLRKIVSTPDTACWILQRSSRQVQAWFENSCHPCVVLGRRHPGIQLPQAHFDLEAVCRHAAHTFHARGRNNLVFLSVDTASAGDATSAHAFLAAASSCGARARVVTFNDTIHGLRSTIIHLMADPSPPDGILVAFPNHVWATIGQLNQLGRDVPGDTAVISRMDSVLLAGAVPTVARYQMDTRACGRALARLVLKAAKADGRHSKQSFTSIPDFIDGQSANPHAR